MDLDRMFGQCLLESYKSLLPEVKKMAHFGRGNRLYKFLRNVSFSLTTRNPPKVRLPLTSRYLGCLLDFGDLEFPLDVTSGVHCH